MSTDRVFLFFNKNLDKAFALSLLFTGIYLKWRAGLFGGDIGFFSLVSTATTITLIFVILRSIQPKKIRIDATAVLASVLAVLPSFWIVHINEKNEPITILAALFAKCLYDLFLIFSYIHIGKNFGFLPAIREVVTSGPYKLLRHPIYSAYIHVQVILLALMMTPLQFGTVLVLVVTSYIRIKQEEEILSESLSYVEYRKKVPDLLFRPAISLPALCVICVKAFIEINS